MPKVSVIIPNYNLGQYLPQTLRSVEAQTFEDWECLIVDNGSTDGSMGIINDFCASDLRFIPVAFKENMGVAAARNRGLELAEGEYILFLDADDLIGPDYMASAVKALDADPSLDIVYARAELFGTKAAYWDLPPFSMETIIARNCLYISCFFRRTAAVPFDPSFKTGLEDWDFWLSLLEKIEEPHVMRLPEVYFYYRIRRNSRNKGVTDQAMVEIRRQLWEKHKALYAKYFCNPLETVEYKRLENSFMKASRWSPAWKLRLLYRRLFT